MNEKAEELAEFHVAEIVEEKINAMDVTGIGKSVAAGNYEKRAQCSGELIIGFVLGLLNVGFKKKGLSYIKATVSFCIIKNGQGIFCIKYKK